jgi:signal transduction histidine kinase/CheY-like chemotaxis protein
MSYPEKHFEYFAAVSPTIVEALLIPFSVNEKIVGTVWIVTHTPGHHFDNEDVRIITNLAAFAAAGFKTQKIQKGLETAIRHRDEFLAILSHELRNPLSPMTTAHSVLSASQLDENEQRPAVDVIGRQLAHMQRLVDDILDVSRIAEGKIAVARRAVEIGGLVNEAVDSVKSRAEQSGLRLNITIPTQPVYVSADPGRIIQIINNLLINAIKFTPANGEISVNMDTNNLQVRISIRDTGVGLAPESLSSIFSMFAQVDGLSKSKGGLGIGLGLAKTLTELHDGTITVRSDGLNCGSEFSIHLPIISAVQTDAQIAVALRAPSAESTPALRILIADDHRDAADSLSMLLGLAGHQVKIVYNGLDTIVQAAAWFPHVILHDLSLPGLDGYEAIEQLRRNPLTRHCVMVAVTGHASEADRKRTKESGFDAHLVKPLDIAVLRKLLKEVVIYDGTERRKADRSGFATERRRRHFDSRH